MTTTSSSTCETICPCDETCPLGEAIAMIGGKWKLRILCSLTVDGTQRYNDLKQKITGITPAMLSSSLKELEQSGLVTRRQYAEMPVRVEYCITDRGSELWPILHQLAHWALGEPLDSDEITRSATAEVSV